LVEIEAVLVCVRFHEVFDIVQIRVCLVEVVEVYVGIVGCLEAA
jgi:hypothetical protein